MAIYKGGGDARRQRRADFKNWLFHTMLTTFEKDLADRAPYLAKGRDALGISEGDAVFVYAEVKRMLSRKPKVREERSESM